MKNSFRRIKSLLYWVILETLYLIAKHDTLNDAAYFQKIDADIIHDNHFSIINDFIQLVVLEIIKLNRSSKFLRIFLHQRKQKCLRKIKTYFLHKVGFVINIKEFIV